MRDRISDTGPSPKTVTRNPVPFYTIRRYGPEKNAISPTAAHADIRPADRPRPIRRPACLRRRMPRPRHRIFRRTARFDGLPDHFPDHRMRPVSATRKTGRYSHPEDRSDTHSFSKPGDRHRRTRRIERQQTERHRSFDGHRMLRHGRPACDDRTRPYARPRAAYPNRLFLRKPGPTLREAGGTNFPSTHENTEPPFPKERPAERPVPQPLSPFRNRFILPAATVCESRPTVRGEREPPGPSHRFAKKGGHDFESVPCSPVQNRVRPPAGTNGTVTRRKTQKAEIPFREFPLSMLTHQDSNLE